MNQRLFPKMNNKNILILSGIILILIIFLLFYFYMFNGEFSNNSSDWNSFGCYIGGVMAPILGIVSIILTYNIISNQSIDSRQAEFRFMFDKFFTPLEVHKNSIKAVKGKTEYTDKKAISVIVNSFRTLILSLVKSGETEYNQIINEAFDNVYIDCKGSFSPFMKNIHFSLKVIDEYCVQDKKEIYAAMVRAQLGDEELKLLLYDGLVFKEFKSNIEKYSMLQDIESFEGVHDNIKRLYKNSAFNKRNHKS